MGTGVKGDDGKGSEEGMARATHGVGRTQCCQEPWRAKFFLFFPGKVHSVNGKVSLGPELPFQI